LQNDSLQRAVGTKSREVIYGGVVMSAKIRTEGARKRAMEAAREADRAEAEAWSIRMEPMVDRRSPRRPSLSA
jgi:hypothetical protein